MQEESMGKLVNIVGNERWDKAQNYERIWWSKRVDSIDIIYLREFSEELIRQINPYLKISAPTRILEIGSGPAGILTFILQSEERYAVEPLEDFFGSVSDYQNFRDKKVHYYKARGESLPFEDSFFDLVIMDNVLDHCQYPGQVLDEANRVLRNGGIVWLRVHTYHLWGKFIRSLMELLQIDAGHPHTFTKRQLSRMFSETDLKTIHFEHRGYLFTFLNEVKSMTLKNLSKVLLLATRDRTLYILKRG
jgi:SAM-dependent methyltransferase